MFITQSKILTFVIVRALFIKEFFHQFAKNPRNLHLLVIVGSYHLLFLQYIYLEDYFHKVIVSPHSFLNHVLHPLRFFALRMKVYPTHSFTNQAVILVNLEIVSIKIKLIKTISYRTSFI